MKRFLLILPLLMLSGLMLSGETGEIVSNTDPSHSGIIPDEARELILFDSNGFIFGSYMRVGLHRNADANMMEGKSWWDVKNGYDGQRFMNEGNYSEWLFAYESPRNDPGWWGGAYLRLAFDIPEYPEAWANLSSENYGIILPEAFFRLGYGQKSWNFWLGRRYNDKVAINMMDYYVANLDGNGLGMENIEIGDATLDINWLFSYNPNAEISGTDFTYPGKNTWAFVFRGVKAGPGSFTFFVAPSFQSGGSVDDYNPDGEVTTPVVRYFDKGFGGFLTAKYLMSSFFGLEGETEFYASAGFGTGANQHSDTDLEHYDASDYSIFAGMQGFALATDTISWRTTLHYEHRSWETDKNFLSFGFRPLFRVAPIFGIQLEYDLEAAMDTGMLGNRITLAPTFLPKNGNTTSSLQVSPYIAYGYGDFKGGDGIAVSSGSLHKFTWGVFGNVGF